MIVYFSKLAEIENTHSASNIHTNDIGDNLVAQVAGETDDASGSGMNVGHDAYLLVGEHINGEQFLICSNAESSMLSVKIFTSYPSIVFIY